MSDVKRSATARPEGGSTPPAIETMSFEDALAELEQIVRGLEGGQQKLEDAIAAYERGAAAAPALRGQAGRGRGTGRRPSSSAPTASVALARPD